MTRFTACGSALLVLIPTLLLVGCSKEEPKEAPQKDAPPDIYGLPPAPDTGLDPVGKVREAANRMQCMNNLRQIGLAMHNYHDAMGFMPPAAFSENGTNPGLSWRVAILPYIEHNGLYLQFKLNEPWDSTHNKKLIPQMPKTYALPGRVTELGVTYYRVLWGDPQKNGPDTPLFEKPVQGRPFQPRVNLASIPDGSSNTLMVVTAAEGVPWTKPDEMDYLPKQKVPPFGFAYGRICPVLLTDGSVRGMQDTISERTLRALISRAGGEPVGSDW